MKQSRRMSAVEAVGHEAVKLGLAALAGVASSADLRECVERAITAMDPWVVGSILCGYVLRRLFERLWVRGAPVRAGGSGRAAGPAGGACRGLPELPVQASR
jgi:hypothetical protein